MSCEFSFLIAPEYSQSQERFPWSDRRNISFDEMKELIEAGVSYWGDCMMGGRLFFAKELEKLIQPIAPELTINHSSRLGFQFFLSGRANQGNCSIAVQPCRKETIFPVSLDCQTPYFAPSNAFFSIPDSIAIVQEYFLHRGNVSKSSYGWLTVREKDADFDNPNFWVELARVWHD